MAQDDTPPPARHSRAVRDGSAELDWLSLQLGALYRHDVAGRITHFNGFPHDDGPAPFLFFGRTRFGNLWRVRAGLPDALVRDLFRWAASESVSEDLEAKPERFAVMRSRLEEFVTVEIEWGGPAFRFPEETPGVGEARPLTLEELPLFADWLPEHGGTAADRAPIFGVMREGRPVSVAYCATVPGAASEVGVQTAPAWRGHGFAAQVVAGWAREMQRRAVVPLYSTGWDNAASRAVARKLGLICYGSDLHLR